MTRPSQRTFGPILAALLAAALLVASEAHAQHVARVAGTWDTTWAGGRAMLELRQNGTDVAGTYSGTNVGKVRGTVAGNVLTGRWLGAANDSGGFVLEFSADGRQFRGTWGNDTSSSDGGPWVGKRK